MAQTVCRFFFFFNDTATTEIYTLSLHDALPISRRGGDCAPCPCSPGGLARSRRRSCKPAWRTRSEEHTSELQSQSNIVCRLLLEKKKTMKNKRHHDGQREARVHTDKEPSQQ